MPTPGQTVLHPSQPYKFFIHEMAAEGVAVLEKGIHNSRGTVIDLEVVKDGEPTIVINEDPPQKKAGFPTN
eukprot:scaffold6485_cov172-Amphora_coffeaeformis.AAC.6